MKSPNGNINSRTSPSIKYFKSKTCKKGNFQFPNFLKPIQFVTHLEGQENDKLSQFTIYGNFIGLEDYFDIAHLMEMYLNNMYLKAFA